MSVDVEAMPGMVLIKNGTLDEGLKSLEPGMEIYTKNRPSFCPILPGTVQKESA